MKCRLMMWLVALLLSTSVMAQSTDQSDGHQERMILTGVVYDIHGSVIVHGTKIIARDKDEKEYVTATNNEGIYKFELPIATYRIDVLARGFCDERLEGFKVVNSTYGKMSLDFVLEAREGHRPCRYESTLKKRTNRRNKVTPEIVKQ